MLFSKKYKMSTRLNNLIVGVGERGTGKTTDALELAYAQKKRIIAVDKEKHPRYINEGFTLITGAGCITKLLGYIDTQEHLYIVHSYPEKILEVLDKCFSNAFVILEDSAQYLPEKIRNGSVEKAFIANCRKRNFDVVFMFHYLAEVPDYLCKNYDYIVLHKTGDPLNISLRRFPNWHVILAAMQKVANAKDYNYSIVIPKHGNRGQ